jgi:hypothetical protein
MVSLDSKWTALADMRHEMLPNPGVRARGRPPRPISRQRVVTQQQIVTRRSPAERHHFYEGP